MKKHLLTFLSVLFFYGVQYAQIATPAPSPSAKLEQKVGLVDITVEYSRPGKKGRTIFGKDGLVEYGKVWRTGANAVSKVTFSDDVKINGSELKKGSYALLSIPDVNMWKVHFYNYETSSWGAYTEKTPALVVDAKPTKANMAYESFTIDFADFNDGGATMMLAWDNVAVPVGISVETDKAVMASIEKVMAGPSTNDFYNAASYYHSSGKDLNQALEWIQKATKVENPRFWQVRREAMILADLGRYKEAITAAKLSKELAMTAGNDEYVKMNEKSITEWMTKK